jgi:hypothetical protein
VNNARRAASFRIGAIVKCLARAAKQEGAAAVEVRVCGGETTIIIRIAELSTGPGTATLEQHGEIVL